MKPRYNIFCFYSSSLVEGLHMKSFFCFLIGVGGLLASPPFASAQLILLGCTSNVDATGPNSNIVDIDPLTGIAVNPRNTGVFSIGGIATQPLTGVLFGLTTNVSTPANSLIQIDPFTGNTLLVGSTGLPRIVEGDLAFNPLDGMLYGLQDLGVSVSDRNFFRINPANGAATVISNLGSTGDYSALAFDPIGTLFVINSGGTGNSLLHTMDPISGSILSTTIMSNNLKSGVGMTFHPVTGVAYVADGGQEAGPNTLFTLNTMNATLTAIGDVGIPGGINGLAFVSVPEPSSLGMVSAALLAIGKHLFARNST